MASGDHSKQCGMYIIPGNDGQGNGIKGGSDRNKKNKNKRNKRKKIGVNHSFINPFIAFATAKLDLATTCLESLVTSGIA